MGLEEVYSEDRYVEDKMYNKEGGKKNMKLLKEYCFF